MNDPFFNDPVRALIGAISRRGLLHRLAAAGLMLPRSSGVTEARKRKKRSKKPKPNAFGCLDVGKACAGKSSKCCSGICQGKKPKKGKKDKSKCVAHNTGGCSPEQDTCIVEPDIPCGANGVCARTTGNAGFCAYPVKGEFPCAACKKDTDCELGLGPGAACIVCELICAETGGTLCDTPAA
jgi:hypothetical protein